MLTKYIRFGAVLAVLLPVSTPALAQVSCTAFSASQPGVLRESVAETVGDVILTCAGTVSGSRFTGPQKLSLSGNFSIAGREHVPTVASLLVNDCTTNSGYSSSSPSFSCADNGTFTSGVPTPGFVENGELVFSGFTLPAGTNENFQLHLTDIRVDPSQLAAGTSITGAIRATFPVRYSSGLVLGTVHSSLNDPAGSRQNFLVCQPVSGPCPITAGLAGNAAAASGKSIGALSSPAPSVTALTPSLGSGLSQTFTFVFSDTLGYQDFAYQQIIINSVLSPGGGCFIYFGPSSNQVYLGTNSGAGVLGPATLGTSGTLQNSQCSLNVGSSSAIVSGDSLTLALALTFESGFSGLKTIWALTASNDGQNSGWETMGTWTPANQVPPSATSLTPSTGTGLSQTFTFSFADPLGYQDFAYQQIIINSSLSPTNGCFIYYSPSSNQVYLGTNSGAGVVGPGIVGTSGTLQNSQCSLNVGSSAAFGSGDNLTLSLFLTFVSGFSGAKTIWALTASNDGINSGWETMGTWTPATQPPPTVTSVTPSSGAGLSQTFSFALADTLGYQDLAYVQIIVNSTLSPSGGCFIYYSPSNGVIYLGTDSGSDLGSAVLGLGSETLQNSQCILNAGASSAVGSGNNLTLNLGLTFESGFVGAKTIWALTASNDGVNSGWQSVGTWTPASLPPPTVTSVSPTSSTSASQTFTFVFSDPLGYQDLAYVQIVVNSTLSPTGGCFIYYSPASNQIYLGTDSGSAVLGPTLLGQGSLQNSQCILNPSLAQTSAVGSGDNLTLTLTLAAEAGFVGHQTIWALAASNDGLNSGWQSVGTWTPGSVASISVSPSSGTGEEATFVFSYSDPIGSYDISSIEIIIDSTQSLAGGCNFSFAPAFNYIFMYNDAATGTTAGTLGKVGTLQNSQCSLNLAAGAPGTVAPYNVTLQLTFAPGFTGAKTIWASVTTNEGLTTGLENIGTWTP